MYVYSQMLICNLVVDSDDVLNRNDWKDQCSKKDLRRGFQGLLTQLVSFECSIAVAKQKHSLTLKKVYCQRFLAPRSLVFSKQARQGTVHWERLAPINAINAQKYESSHQSILSLTAHNIGSHLSLLLRHNSIKERNSETAPQLGKYPSYSFPKMQHKSHTRKSIFVGS